MYVNPKWSMNLKPSKPGGPTGIRAIKTLLYAVIGRPNVMICLVVGNLVFFWVVVSACWMIGTSVKSLLMLLSPPSVMASHEGGRRYMDRRELFSVDSGIDTREM